jgi:precorrin-2 methylase
MKIRLLSCLLLAGVCSLAHAAECAYPRPPTKTPNGLTATQEEMVAGMSAVKEYNTKVTEYLACLDEEMKVAIATAGPEAPADMIERIKANNAKKHNAAIEALEAHAAQFNEEVRTFKSRDKDKKS